MKRSRIPLLAALVCCVMSLAVTGAPKEDSAENHARLLMNQNVRLVRSFMQYFSTATNEHWFTQGPNFLVKCTVNNKPVRALFTKSGDLVYSIVYGTEKDLPKDIRYQVRSNYFDYHITKATEVNEHHRTIWVVEMVEDNKHLTVRIEDGEMEEVGEYIFDN